MDGQNPFPKSSSKRSANDINNIGDSFFTAPVTDDKDENRESVRIEDGNFFLIGIERQPKKELGDAEGDFGDCTDFVEAVSYKKSDGRLVFCFLEKLDRKACKKHAWLVRSEKGPILTP